MAAGVNFFNFQIIQLNINFFIKNFEQRLRKLTGCDAVIQGKHPALRYRRRMKV